MILDWTKNLKTQDERDELLQRLKNSEVLDRLRELIEEYEQNLDRSEISEQVFDKPNWDVRQAWKLGYRAHLNKMKELLTFT